MVILNFIYIFILIYINIIMNTFQINERQIGKGNKTYIIAELSANHNQNYDCAIKLIDAAHYAGADAIKLQTYRADTITIDCDKEDFQIKGGTLWDGQTLYELYKTAYTPWEWHKDLKEYANSLGMDLFSSPFDVTAVDYLENLDMPAYKIASCEITDHILIKKIAQTCKPVIISSGNASIDELQEAVDVLRNNGCTQICMLKCTAAYPAKKEDANLITINDMIKQFNVVGGLSDHTLGIEVPTLSVAMGASVIEKHFTLSRDSGSPDDAFSLTPDEFKQMVESVRMTESIMGNITYGGIKSEKETKKHRRSLYIVKDMKKGDKFTENNLKSIRPGNGIHTKHYWDILGKECNQDIEFGTPMKIEFLNNYILCEKLDNNDEINGIKVGSTSNEIEERNIIYNLLKNSPIKDDELVSNLGLYIPRQAMTRILTMNELYKKIINLHGNILEFGVRWGQNLSLFTVFKGIYEPYNYTRQIIGFDTFNGFLNIDNENDPDTKDGDYNVTNDYENYLSDILKFHIDNNPISHISKTSTIKGDATLTIKDYFKNNKHSIIAFAYFDFDIYKPTIDCLNAIKPHLTKGAIIAFDELNLSDWPGETIAFKEFFNINNVSVYRTQYDPIISYIIYNE